MHYLAMILALMFLTGMAGSVIVIVLTFTDDVSEILTSDQAEAPSQTIGTPEIRVA